MSTSQQDADDTLAGALTITVPTADMKDALLAAVATRDLLDVEVWDGLGPLGRDARRAALVVAPYKSPPMDAAVLAELADLRAVQVLSAGYDGWEDVLPPGVALLNGRGVHGASTAEMAVAGLLSVVREIPAYVHAQARRSWEPSIASSVDGANILVLGGGDIGRRVASILVALGARVTVAGRTARDGV
ncbi:MAG TPA: NAD(P)-dependent oxidoreductase, partial [Cellulomonas sp.]|nr:NAD(P)-dependent oxidoreductase [Cellulomonas sp.]